MSLPALLEADAVGGDAGTVIHERKSVLHEARCSLVALKETTKGGLRRPAQLESAAHQTPRQLDAGFAKHFGKAFPVQRAGLRRPPEEFPAWAPDLRGRLRFTDKQRRLLAAKAKALGRTALRKLDTIVAPDTLLRWHRQLIAQKYDGSGRRGPGRPRIMNEIEALIVRMATENRWGYLRITGALANLVHIVDRTTIANVLARHGIEPPPERKSTWAEFLRSHWEVLASTDSFTVEAGKECRSDSEGSLAAGQ